MSPVELRRLEACHALAERTLTQQQAALRLGISERQVRRLWKRFRTQGEQAVLSRRRGRASNRRLAAALVQSALDLVAQRYADFGPTFANEKLREEHGLVLSTESLRQAMIHAKIWHPQRHRARKVHPPRERRPQFGELVQIDGSAHDWFEGRAPKCTLLVFIDDATSALLGLRFVKSESTWSYFLLLRQYIAKYGRPLALYSDRHTIFRSPQALTTTGHTQVGRALAQLDIELICANSPQAKGRVERANKTLQRRLVRELRLRNVASMEEGNAVLEELRLRHNERFAHCAAVAGDAHRTTDEVTLEAILSVHHERTLSKDQTFQLGHSIYAIEPPSQPARTRKITLIEHPDGSFNLRADRQTLTCRKVRDVPQAPIRDAKELSEPQNRRIPNPKKAHIPPATHPWRLYPLRRPPIGPDISTWRGPDIIT